MVISSSGAVGSSTIAAAAGLELSKSFSTSMYSSKEYLMMPLSLSSVTGTNSTGSLTMISFTVSDRSKKILVSSTASTGFTSSTLSNVGIAGISKVKVICSSSFSVTLKGSITFISLTSGVVTLKSISLIGETISKVTSRFLIKWFIAINSFSSMAAAGATIAGA